MLAREINSENKVIIHNILHTGGAVDAEKKEVFVQEVFLKSFQRLRLESSF